jgi:hypothetical protein
MEVTKERVSSKNDKIYTRGIEIAQPQQTNISNRYLELILRKAQKQYSMKNYKLCIISFPILSNDIINILRIDPMLRMIQLYLFDSISSLEYILFVDYNLSHAR